MGPARALFVAWVVLLMVLNRVLYRSAQGLLAVPPVPLVDATIILIATQAHRGGFRSGRLLRRLFEVIVLNVFSSRLSSLLSFLQLTGSS